MTPKWLGRKEIASRAKELRDRIGVSQAELAERIGLKKGQGAISDLEKGKWRGAAPNAKLLLSLCQLAGEEIGYFRVGGAVVLTEADEKRIAAKWMERAARRLRKEATGGGRASAAKVEAARRARLQAPGGVPGDDEERPPLEG